MERTFDPVEIYKAMCLRLYDYDTSMRLVSELAAGLPTISKDRLTYLIPLRHGVRFNDGTPFNAQAVVTTIERDLTIPGGTRVSDLAPIAGISARSDYTVAIHLEIAVLAPHEGARISGRRDHVADSAWRSSGPTSGAIRCASARSCSPTALSATR